MEEYIMKKVILVVSFGMSYLDVLKNLIDKIENRIKDEFKGYDVFRVFIVYMIIKKLKVIYDMVIFIFEEVLEDLKNKGYEEVVV